MKGRGWVSRQRHTMALGCYLHQPTNSSKSITLAIVRCFGQLWPRLETVERRVLLRRKRTSNRRFRDSRTCGKENIMKLVLSKFRVRNFRNIDDSGWIPVEPVTALVGRNESGKTALLKALHKFNPATEEPYNPQREFPRDRFIGFLGRRVEFVECFQQ